MFLLSNNVLSRLNNMATSESVSESCLRRSQKAAIVIPIAKKIDLDKADLENVRSVFNPTPLSKLLK